MVYRWATLQSFKSSGDYIVIRVVLPSEKISSLLKYLEKYSFQKNWYEMSSPLLQFSFHPWKMSCESDHIESRVHLEFHSTCILEEVRLIYVSREKCSSLVSLQCQLKARPHYTCIQSTLKWCFCSPKNNLQIGRLWKHRIGSVECMVWMVEKAGVKIKWPCYRLTGVRSSNVCIPFYSSRLSRNRLFFWSFPDYCGRYNALKWYPNDSGFYVFSNLFNLWMGRIH